MCLVSLCTWLQYILWLLYKYIIVTIN
uniref:Uncharacterized protein n=1 Tax=Arundo donax TaxID=35708 RepID=A0A0A9AJ58_ARUDO